MFSENSLKEALKEKKQKKGKKILVEYCHANTHKAFHIGHTRNICLGESICRILEENGNKVIRANYQGDIGMHVAKTIYGLLNLNKIGLKEPKENKGIQVAVTVVKVQLVAVLGKLKTLHWNKPGVGHIIFK